MKKVLSVAMASAMVLGMGANAFAIQYNVASSDTAEWPKNFQFDGELFVTDKDGAKKETGLGDEIDADFNPGDVIWMPLYADGQLVYENEGATSDTAAKPAVKDVRVADGKSGISVVASTGTYTKTESGDYEDATGNVVMLKDNQYVRTGDGTNFYILTVTEGTVILPTDVQSRKDDVTNVRYVYNGSTYTSVKALADALEENSVFEADAMAKVGAIVDLKAVDKVDGENGNAVTTGKTKYGVYTGNIDKDWSINLIEEKGKASDVIEKAELYKATSKDAKKYGATAKGVYLKVTLKDEWKSVETVNLKYYVYISENGTENKTNKVWVAGDYENKLTKEVSFTWTNNANTPAVWEVKEGSGNGVAVFDYNDKAFFTVKMYEGEKLYLDLGTAYDRLVSNEIYDASGAEVDSFYNFITADANFSRSGELVLVTDDDSLVPYQVDEDGNLVEVDAEYVKGYTIAHTNEKVNGFVFNTKELGNYILSEEIVVEEEEEPAEPEVPETETPAEPEAPVVEEKPNPNTGAEDFVGLAVSLAVVSVAAAGALALKK